MTISTNLDYWELRSVVSKIVPRMTQLSSVERAVNPVREKGRKKNYSQFNLRLGEWRRQERLLNTEEINSFLEISVRAAACPMPFNMDIWDGLLCPFGCIYCYADAFRASLYTAFFDNSKDMGFRHCNPDYYKREMDKMLELRGGPVDGLSGIQRAFAQDIPVRMGIRFEDFLYAEKREGISLEMMKYLADIEYPLMLNTKSHIVGMDEYVDALASNPARTAVHFTAITSDDDIIRRLEPSAPAYARRLKAIKALTQAGVRVVARIEPYLFLVTDQPDDVEQHMDRMWEAGVRNITFDTYSYTARNPGIRQNFMNAGFDFDRIYLAGCDSQLIGSLLLGKFMELFRERGFSVSTFDMGNVPSNDQAICCEVGDWFQGGFNYGCTVMAARFIAEQEGPVNWGDFVLYVEQNGGFLSPALKRDVHELWNMGGNSAYSHSWAEGLAPCGSDRDGLIWIKEDKDRRIQLLEEII
jgi:DNA repair photolyase